MRKISYSGSSVWLLESRLSDWLSSQKYEYYWKITGLRKSGFSSLRSFLRFRETLMREPELQTQYAPSSPILRNLGVLHARALFQYQIRGYIADLKQIQTGVPQGSVLGPILHLLYTIEIPTCCRYICWWYRNPGYRRQQHQVNKKIRNAGQRKDLSNWTKLNGANQIR